MTTAFKRTCECDLRYRRWNPNTGRCETCGAKFMDRRDGLRTSENDQEKSS